MINKFKKIIMFGVFSLVLPISVKADHSATFTCEKYTIAPGERVTCSINANVGTDSASAFSTQVSLGDNLNYVSFTKNSFFNEGGDVSQVENTNSYIITMANSNGTGKTGEFKIADIVVEANNQSGVESTISFEDSKFSIDVPNDTVTSQITIEGKTITISADAVNPGSNEGTTDTTDNSSNTNTGDTESSKSDSKKGNAVSNPKTGVKVSVASLIILAVGAGAYVVLRKKNYFNKI